MDYHRPFTDMPLTIVSRDLKNTIKQIIPLLALTCFHQNVVCRLVCFEPRNCPHNQLSPSHHRASTRLTPHTPVFSSFEESRLCLLSMFFIFQENHTILQLFLPKPHFMSYYHRLHIILHILHFTSNFDNHVSFSLLI